MPRLSKTVGSSLVSHSTLYEHPLVFGSFCSWLRLLRQSNHIEPRFYERVLLVCLSTLASSPLRWIESLRYGKAVAITPIHPAPVFIVGHWRTGTTHLHNLLVQDPDLAFVSTFQTMAPGFFLTGNQHIRPLLNAIARRIHPTRLIDNIPLSFDAPQEEDFAVANLSPYSFLHLFTFPQQADYFFERYALFQDLPAQTLAEWKEIYLGILRKATFKAQGRRLVLKNPVNSGRIPAILELFPDARFIHITRSPYNIFPSMRVVYQNVLPRSQVQSIDPQQIDRCILDFYSLLMQKFLHDKALIPPANLVEIRFEDLDTEPLAQLRHIYQTLQLPGYEQVEPAFKNYLASVADYQKNRYLIDDEVINQVNDHWRFALDTWNYSILEPANGRLK
jgi:hypothetical protein